MNQISHISSSQIDSQKWDACIAASVNENPLAYKWALDGLCNCWIGIVMDDYKGVVPVPVEYKFFSLTSQLPPDVQYFGVFCCKDVNPSVILHHLFQNHQIVKFRFLSLSFHLPLRDSLPDCRVNERTTFHLILENSYDRISAGYSRRHKRNLRYFAETGFSVSHGSDINALIELRSIESRSNIELFLSPQQIILRKSFLNEALKKGAAKVYYVKDCNGDVQGGGVFIFGIHRIVFFMLTSSPIGLAHRSGFAIVDAFVRDHQGYDGYLDFFGSDISSIAEFNRGFGSQRITYYNYTVNRWNFCFRTLQKYRALHRIKSWIR